MSVLDWSKFSKMSGGRNPLFECPDSYRHQRLPSISKGEARKICQGLHCFRRRLKSNYHGHNAAIPFDHQKKDLGNTQCPLIFRSEGIKATLLDFYPVGSIFMHIADWGISAWATEAKTSLKLQISD